MNLSHKPRLSIGLPVHNGEGFLAQAIESLVGQSDSRIVYHRGAENRGAAWNFNHVVHLADGEYFKWAAYDDVCAPELVERCIHVLDHRSPVVLCYTKSYIIDEHGTVLSAYDNPVNATGATPYERFRNVLTNLAEDFEAHGEVAAIVAGPS
jgi:glycosyltransferase involved in cell wall biosynthesis